MELCQLTEVEQESLGHKLKYLSNTYAHFCDI